MAQMRVIVAELRGVANSGEIPRQFRAELAKAARPFAPAVRASILNIPTHGEKHTGLRVRIARCVQTWAEIHTGGFVSVGIEIDSSRMPSGQMSLPLMMEGVKIWRHPVFGNREVWVTQDSHPYFYQAVAGYGPASRLAMEKALQTITRKISGLSA